MIQVALVTFIILPNIGLKKNFYSDYHYPNDSCSSVNITLGNCMESEGVVPLNNSIFNPKMTNHSIDIYFFTMSPPSRAALLLIRALGLKHNIKVVNIMSGEQMDPEFIKMNPLHTVPVINDGGFILYDSNAIMKYLVDQYAKDDSLFPKDPKKSAIVTQRLFFVSGTLFPRFIGYHFPTLMNGVKGDEENLNKLEEALRLLDTFLKGQTWIAGNNMTVADFAAISVISTIHSSESCDVSSHPNLWQWFQKTKSAMESFGYEEVMQSGADAFGAIYKSRLK